MTASDSEIINKALKQIVSPMVKEHIEYMKVMDMIRRDVSMQRERMSETEWRGRA